MSVCWLAEREELNMPTEDHELDEQEYHELLTHRHLTDAVLRQPLRHLRIPKPVCVSPNATMQETVEAMRNSRVGVVLITDPGTGKLAGIFTERDLLLRVAGRGWNFREHQMSEVMTPNPACLSPDERIGFVLSLMLTQGFRHIPVLDEQGLPTGIVSQRFLLSYLCEYFPEDVLNQPPQSALTAPPKEQHGG
jgi:CBS domain-containing protein